MVNWKKRENTRGHNLKYGMRKQGAKTYSMTQEKEVSVLHLLETG